MIDPKDIRIEESVHDGVVTFKASLLILAEIRIDARVLQSSHDADKKVESIKEDLHASIMRHIYGELHDRIQKLEFELKKEKSQHSPYDY